MFKPEWVDIWTILNGVKVPTVSRYFFLNIFNTTAFWNVLLFVALVKKYGKSEFIKHFYLAAFLRGVIFKMKYVHT